MCDPELPADPDLDVIAPELSAHPGPWTITVTADTGEKFSDLAPPEHVAATLADVRRAREDDEQA